jgi:cytochrome c-type biogenesis protein CcmH/NrfG
MTRLEQSLQLGADYPDTYFLLGNLYRATGQLDRARWAYGNALRINEGYEEAREALETLTA